MKPSTVKGTRDFNSNELYKRQFVMDQLRQVFISFGFEALETPAFENIETLTGKYGEEGDRLIFKIINSGLNDQKNTSKIAAEFDKMLQQPYTSSDITNKALRYDLTVPLARYVAMNYGTLALPYKRFQIQPVWRADRPQKGRFREFIQCDADVVGSESLLLDTEMILIYAQAFKQLNIPITIHYNNRKILEGIAQYASLSDHLVPFTVSLDKLDKIGKDKVIEELLSKGISRSSIEKLSPLFEKYPSNEAQFQILESLLQNSEIGKEGIAEARQVIQSAIEIGVPESEIQLDLTLARGLDYYTGSIYEVKANEVAMGSIGGGGRYNNLTELFGVKDMPGIGISFGLDRIVLVMEELGVFQDYKAHTSELMFLYFSEKETIEAEKLMMKLRQINVSCEIYPESAKLKKQFGYAEKKGIPFVAFFGEKEQEAHSLTLKNIENGDQFEIDLKDLDQVKSKLANQSSE